MTLLSPTQSLADSCQKHTGHAWVAQSVKYPLAQVMISWFIGSSPTSVSVLTSELEPALDFSLFLSLSLSLSLSISAPPHLPSLSHKNKQTIKKNILWINRGFHSPRV